MADNRNMYLAIALSLAVIFVWQLVFVQPQMEREAAAQRAEQARAAQMAPAATAPAATVAATTAPAAGLPAAPGAEAQPTATTPAPRIKIETASLDGSINLRGGTLDDLKLRDYHVTVDPTSDEVRLLSPAGTPDPYFVETRWLPADPNVVVPTLATEWSVDGNDKLTATTPVTLAWDNGAGLIFRRTIAVDGLYMFTIKQTVENRTGQEVKLYPYSRTRRTGQHTGTSYWIQHEGMIGVLGENGLEEVTYKNMAGENAVTDANGVTTAHLDYSGVTGGWLGITDKYWATAVIPEPGSTYAARYLYTASNDVPSYQADYTGAEVTVAPGATAEATQLVFAGAKKTKIVQAYESDLKIDRFNLLIDWGWFYFLTKPMFHLIDFIQSVVGNFGVAILITTVLVKLLFFPLASKAYASMAKMKALQPKIKAMQERFKDDKMKQQQEMMELYKREKINPLAGCIPIAIQIPVFFSLYKVLFVSIEMRHAPFFGWINDLSAPDPSHVFNLFGLLPYDPTTVPFIGHFLAIGVWPIIMGLTMFVQMKLNPPPPDPTQAMIFNFMPLMFLFLLASFPAGLVIYWAWNNTLSVTQQYIIMRRNGVKPDLWNNIIGPFRRGKKQEAA